MLNMTLRKHILRMLFVDSVLIALSFYISYLIRFQFNIPLRFLDTIPHTLLVIVFVKISIFLLFKMYQTQGEPSTLLDFLNVIRAIFMSTMGSISIILLMYRFEEYPRSIFLIDCAVTFVLIGGLRVGVRFFNARRSGTPLFQLPPKINMTSRKYLVVETGVLITDAIIIVLSFYFAYAIRFDFQIPSNELGYYFHILPFVFIVKMATFLLFRMHQFTWQYTSFADMLNAFKAIAVSTMIIISIILITNRFEGYPRSVFIIDSILTLVFIGATRMLFRLYSTRNREKGTRTPAKIKEGKGKKLLLIGAGSTGERVLREILDNPTLRIVPIGFLDDDPDKQGLTIHGVEVLGSIDQLQSFSHLFDEILITILAASAEEMRAIVSACEKTGKRFRTTPGIGEIIDGKVSVKTIRDVTLEDLLGRKEVHLDRDDISQYLHQKRILITGAGGSIGSDLVRQVNRFRPKALALVEMSEYNLFRIQAECRQRFGYVKTSAYLVDIRDKEGVNRVFSQFRPHVVFHTAAYKHVPMQELHPWEAVRNNVMGSQNLVQAAQENQVEKFVLVSTDKAVRPTNVMGATKRIAEKIVLSTNRTASTQFIVVRFGNVMGSSGSVIPTFQDQIARGGPVTVTHPEVTRYFMSIPEAAQLILQAGAMGRGGEIFLLDMGEPVRIADLARDLIRLHGYQPNQDIAIQYIGLRPGEKLYEELITEGEGIVETTHKKIMVLRGNGALAENFHEQIQQLFATAETFNMVAIKQQLKKIIPEYTPEFRRARERKDATSSQQVSPEDIRRNFVVLR